MPTETVEEFAERKAKTRWHSGLPETVCGRGSTMEQTCIIREFISEVVHEYNIGSVADVGCGDQNWIHHCLPKGIEYTGYDVKPRFVDVKPFDITREILPEPAELVLCIYVLNHLYPDAAEEALKLLKMSRSKYLIMSYSSHDEYALFDCKLIKSIHHKTKKRAHGEVEWRYGLWEL